MMYFILGGIVGGLCAWTAFIIALYPFYKRQATENAMLRDAVEQWQHKAEYLEDYLQDFDAWRGGAHDDC